MCTYGSAVVEQNIFTRCFFCVFFFFFQTFYCNNYQHLRVYRVDRSTFMTSINVQPTVLRYARLFSTAKMGRRRGENYAREATSKRTYYKKLDQSDVSGGIDLSMYRYLCENPCIRRLQRREKLSYTTAIDR